jgi:hypothetical protein
MEMDSEGENSHSEQDRRLLFWGHVPFRAPAGFLFIFLSESISNYPFPLDKANHAYSIIGNRYRYRHQTYQLPQLPVVARNCDLSYDKDCT